MYHSQPIVYATLEASNSAKSLVQPPGTGIAASANARATFARTIGLVS